MNIAQISITDYGFTKIDFLGNRSFLDFDYIIIDFDKIILEIAKYEPDLNKLKSKVFFAHGNPVSRNNDFIDALNHNRKFIIITPYNYKLEYNKITYTMSQVFSIISIFDFVGGDGLNVDIKNEKLKKISIDNNVVFTYNSVIEGKIGNVLASIKNTEHAISAMPNDSMIFLPKIYFKDSQKVKRFFYEIINSFFTIDEEKESLPDWALEFTNNEEAKFIKEYIDLKKEQVKIEENIRIKSLEIEKQNELKRLFISTGNELENIVLEVFTNMGFESLPSEANRHDLILKYKEQIIVVEIKGVTGSAAEKNAAQLEKWVTEYNAEYEVHPKGILVVNAFKDLPIDKRTEPVFPNQMLKFAKNRDHCLISGLQLYGFYLAYLKSNEKEKMIDELLQTVGVYAKFNDYKEFLSFREKL